MTDFSPEAVAERARVGREKHERLEAEVERRYAAATRTLRRETLKPSSKLRARYGVYLDGKRIGAVGYTRRGHWWPIMDGRLLSGITFNSRNGHAEWLTRAVIRREVEKALCPECQGVGTVLVYDGPHASTDEYHPEPCPKCREAAS